MRRTIQTGDLLTLGDNALPHARVREFRFVRMEGDQVVLAHKDGDYEWTVDAADITWDDYCLPFAA